jgi:hypothetical protein
MKRPGPLALSLTPVTAYRARQTGIWAEIEDRIAGALTPFQLEEVEAWLIDHELEFPTAWNDPITEMLEKRAEEIEAEEIRFL